RGIGFVLQEHNLLRALTAVQNVVLSASLIERSRRRAQEKALAALEMVQLHDRADFLPDNMSGGEKQRVAIARAVAGNPKLILADEPTAFLDGHSGREVVEIMRRLAYEQRRAVLMVTHDARILDVADRIVRLEDGRLVSFTSAVAADNARMMSVLARNVRGGKVLPDIESMSSSEFVALLKRLTHEFEDFLRITEIGNDEVFDSLLSQLIEAFTRKVGKVLGAEVSSLFLVDEEAGQLWSKVAQGDDGHPIDIRISLSSGIAGRVARTGSAVNTADAYQDPDFNADVDKGTGFRTRSMMCVPIRDVRGQIFAVAELLNKIGSDRFDESDERCFQEFTTSIGVLLESWWKVCHQRHTQHSKTA